MRILCIKNYWHLFDS